MYTDLSHLFSNSLGGCPRAVRRCCPCRQFAGLKTKNAAVMGGQRRLTCRIGADEPRLGIP
ncbi:hypothetical protein SUH3_00325 [Pseudosulfitobacter pseudonitzschiae]|uniref:Uncharacterized protein n=1 Tax=Pseudosulfitobacter pseudonitzschiae TaxID=1402135 RepID=A0A073J6N7_9RHOB|nr:hypothetical protein SUH3_00325 [Pseudosulfitobacter pseudonitzschiae]